AAYTWRAPGFIAATRAAKPSTSNSSSAASTEPRMRSVVIGRFPFVCTAVPGKIRLGIAVFKHPRLCMAVPIPSRRMARKLDADELVGTAEIAERLGVARAQTVHTWRLRYEDFPEPVAHLKQALVWYWPDVERWARANGRGK